MLLKEFRVVLPLTVDEYKIGQLYSVAMASKKETGGGEGVQVLQNEAFTSDSGISGQYTKKIYHLDKKVPAFIRVLLPAGALEIYEEAWNSYPECKTVLTNGYMKDNFKLVVESKHFDGDVAAKTNVFHLSPEEQKLSSVCVLDIANDCLEDSFKVLEDPQKFKSEKTSRGPLGTNWMNCSAPVMTCYKLVRIEFKWFGLQTRMENYIISIQREIFLKFHKQVFCWIDEWFGLTMQDIRELEEETKKELDIVMKLLIQKRNKGVHQVKGRSKTAI